MTETMEELLARIRLAMIKDLGFTEVRIPEGWNYKLLGKVVAFVGKKRALLQVSVKLPPPEAAAALERVDVEPHPSSRLAAANWITINVFEEAQLPFVLDSARKSASILAGKALER